MKIKKQTNDKIYAIMVREYEYNDEYSFPQDSYSAGFFVNLDDAKKYCIEKNKDLCLKNDWRTSSEVAYDGTYESRWELWGIISDESIEADPYLVYDKKINWQEMFDYIEEHNLMLSDYLPDVYFVNAMKSIETKL